MCLTALLILLDRDGNFDFRVLFQGHGFTGFILQGVLHSNFSIQGFRAFNGNLRSLRLTGINRERERGHGTLGEGGLCVDRLTMGSWQCESTAVYRIWIAALARCTDRLFVSTKCCKAVGRSNFTYWAALAAC